MSRLLVGSTLDNKRYLIKELIGQGGMGEVYLGHQVSVDRPVAIKVLHSHLTSDPNLAKRFHREAKLMATLNNPHCVTVYEYGETEDGILFIVMEILHGHTLAEEIYQKGRLTLKESISILNQICFALQAAHHMGLVHRDLKPENIHLTLKDDGFHVTVLDFGIAKIMQAEESLETIETSAQESDRELQETEQAEQSLDESEAYLETISTNIATPNRRTMLTQPGIIVGTPLYMSPEQTLGLPVDHRADIYALGLIFYECLVGKPVFAGDTPIQIMIAHTQQPPPTLKDTIPNAPEIVSTLIHQCLKKKREQRVSNVVKLSEILKQITDSIDLYTQSMRDDLDDLNPRKSNQQQESTQATSGLLSRRTSALTNSAYFTAITQSIPISKDDQDTEKQTLKLLKKNRMLLYLNLCTITLLLFWFISNQWPKNNNSPSTTHSQPKDPITSSPINESQSSSPKSSSPKHSSPKRSSPKRSSPKRSSPKKKPKKATVHAELPLCPFTLNDVSKADQAGFHCMCPPSLSSAHHIYGTNIYTGDSNICKAARHAGVINSTGGKVFIKKTQGYKQYRGTLQNGVKSHSWNSYYHTSFYFDGTLSYKKSN